MQAVTHIGPGIGLLGSLAFVCSFVGVTAPLVYFVAMLIILSMGISLTQLARHLPSAGGFYGYRTQQRRMEFNVLLHLVLPLVASIALAFIFYNSVIPIQPQGTPAWWAIVVVPIWMILGVILVLFVGRTRAESQILAMEHADEELREARHHATPS
jgi:amino acid transporter